MSRSKFKENCETITGQGGTKKGPVIRMEDEVYKFQDALGLKGKERDGMLGKNTSKLIAEKYGDINNPEVRAKMPPELQKAYENIEKKIGKGMFKQHQTQVDANCKPGDGGDAKPLLPLTVARVEQGSPYINIAVDETATDIAPVQIIGGRAPAEYKPVEQGSPYIAQAVDESGQDIAPVQVIGGRAPVYEPVEQGSPYIAGAAQLPYAPVEQGTPAIPQTFVEQGSPHMAGIGFEEQGSPYMGRSEPTFMQRLNNMASSAARIMLPSSSDVKAPGLTNGFGAAARGTVPNTPAHPYQGLANLPKSGVGSLRIGAP